MIPVLLWLAIWRRETFAGAVVTGALGSAVALVYFGPNSYADWMAALGAGSTWLYSPWAGNHGITALVPALWLPVAAVTAMALVVVLARCGPRTGIVWAAASGILLAPYVGTYGALPLAITLPAIGPLSPVLAVAIVAASPIATTHPLPFYAAAIMLAALAFRERRAANESVGMATTAAWEPAAAA
jgi:hypothetical protein